MVEIIDFAPLADEVDVRGHKIRVRGLDIPAIGQLVMRFPELGDMIRDARGGATINLARILELSDDVLGAVISKAAPQISEDGAANLALAEKVDLLEPILRMTMPRGIGPFVQALTKLVGALPSSEPQAPPPAARPNGKGRAAPASRAP